MKRLFGCLAALAAVLLVLGGCSSTNDEASPNKSATSGDPSKPDPRTAGWDIWGNPINGGPKGEDGSTGNNLDRNFCSHNQDKRCPVGSYVGPFTGYHDKHGYWDAQGKPINGGPVGADGSTNNNLTQEYCARNEDPGCPIGSYVGPNAQRDPRGGPHYVKCEGTICTNPNHGAGTDPRTNGGDNTAVGVWDANGNPIAGGPRGADGSTGNNLTQQYCATNQSPACPAGSYVQPEQRSANNPPEPGQNNMQGPNNQGPPEPGQNNMQGPNNNDNGGDQQGPPEPGQNDMQGPNSNDNGGDQQGPPEPNNEGEQQGPPEPGQNDESGGDDS